MYLKIHNDIVKIYFFKTVLNIKPNFGGKWFSSKVFPDNETSQYFKVFSNSCWVVEVDDCVVVL